MTGIERAQTDDMQMLTMFPDATGRDAVADFRYMRYLLPEEDVAEILDVISEGVQPE